MKLILHSEHAQDIQFFQALAGKLSIPFLHAHDLDQLCEELNQDSECIVVIDASTENLLKAFETSIAENIGVFSEKIKPNHIFMVCEKELHACPFITTSELFGNYLPRTFNEENTALFRRILEVSKNGTTVSQLKLERFLEPNAKIQNYKITKATMKLSLVEALKENLVKLGFQIRTAAVIASATDEIIMNATFDAPIDSNGKHIYLNTPRNKEIVLPADKVVDFNIGFDGTTLAISVVDYYGSLNRKKLLGHLSQDFHKEEFKVKSNVAGAGLGMSNVYRNSGGILIENEFGHYTSVTVFYKKTASYKEFKDQFHFLSLHCYYSSDA